MKIKRKDFIISSAVGSAAMVAKVSPFSFFAGRSDKETRAIPKLSFQEGIAPGRNLTEKFDFMENYKIAGFEPRGVNLVNSFGEYLQLLRGRNIKISAVYSGYKGFLLSEDETLRKQYKSTIKDIIAAAGETGSTGVIIVPYCNGQKTTEPFGFNVSLKNFLIEQLSELTEYAENYNTTIILEPLNRKETSGFCKIEDATFICKSVNKKGLRCMGDFWHMSREEESDRKAFISAGEYLNHVHISSRITRGMPGEDGKFDDYTEGFKGLKEIGYQGYISYECGIRGNRYTLLPESVNLIREQWSAS